MLASALSTVARSDLIPGKRRADRCEASGPEIRYSSGLLESSLRWPRLHLLHRARLAKDDDDDGSSKSASKTPNIYLDTRTAYASVPAGSLPIGFGNSALATALQSLALSRTNSLPASPGSFTLPPAQAVVVDLPMTVDVTDNVSLYAGVSASSTSTALTGWSPVAITSWNIGFQADVHKQNGGSIPTLTWQSTITQAIPNGPLATTTFKNIFEFDYAFDKDETRGLLAGVQDVRVEVGSPLAGSIRASSAMSAGTTNGRTIGNSLAALACSRSAALSF